MADKVADPESRTVREQKLAARLAAMSKAMLGHQLLGGAAGVNNLLAADLSRASEADIVDLERALGGRKY